MARIPLSENPPLTYAQIIDDILRPLDGPIPLDELADQIQQIRPSQAKNPRRSTVNQIREAEGKLLVRLPDDQVLPLRLAYQGIRFRLPLDREIVDKGLLDIQAILHSYLPPQFQIEGLQILDAGGRLIPYTSKTVITQVDTFLGPHGHPSLHIDLGAWFRSQRIYRKDHLLFTIEDWDKGVFCLEREAASAIQPDLLQQRDQLLADIFYTMLEEARDEAIYQHITVPKAYSLLPDKGGYPPSHWLVVIGRDERLVFDGWRIHYSDSGFSPLERIMSRSAGESLLPPPPKISKEQGQQVFRFKAEFGPNAKIWRTIEIQGKHILADLDVLLRHAFDHDRMDHLGGFWKLVPRRPAAGKKAGNRTRYREADLASIDPFGEGEGADTKIAALQLQPGDKLKYVYDFGDWIEHFLTLEAIQTPEPGVKYPRQVARNKPEYMDCSQCLKKGQQSRAKWICYHCSEAENQPVVLCQRCAERHDEEHYLEKILY